MHTQSYEYLSDSSCRIFRFTSSGRRNIDKIVVFNSIEPPGCYSLLLGDLAGDGSIDVSGKSNNGDAEIVLSTVAKIIDCFLSQYQGSKIYFEGSTSARTRLYQIAIAKQLPDLITSFNIQGFDNGELRDFQPGRSYQGFVVSRRKD